MQAMSLRDRTQSWADCSMSHTDLFHDQAPKRCYVGLISR